MKAKLVKAYKPQKELNLKNIRFTKILYNNEEYDIYIIHYNEETGIITALSDISLKAKEGDFFYFGEKKDKDFKMQIIK